MRIKFIVLLFLFFFIPLVLFAKELVVEQYKKQYWYLQNYTPKGKVTFKVKENSKYTFKVVIEDKQFAFILKGNTPFVFSIVEPSGNRLEGNTSRGNNLIVFENIMEKGEYKLEIFSPSINEIIMEWGTY